jgi:hypothetical protein
MAKRKAAAKNKQAAATRQPQRKAGKTTKSGNPMPVERLDSLAEGTPDALREDAQFQAMSDRWPFCPTCQGAWVANEGASKYGTRFKCENGHGYDWANGRVTMAPREE